MKKRKGKEERKGRGNRWWCLRNQTSGREEGGFEG
jgi:hypothetical protein